MSLDLSVITDKKLTNECMKSIVDFLQSNGFYKDQYGYCVKDENIFLALYFDMEPEKDDYWTDEPPKAVCFTPLTEISLESRHTRESHEMSYRVARNLAKLLGGVIYDHQVGVVYDSSGEPCDHYKTGDQFEKYGGGMNLFMVGLGLMNDILENK